MSCRALVLDRLQNDSVLPLSLQAFFTTNAVDTPTPEERPFLILRWEELLRGHTDGWRGAGTQSLTVWVHDDDHDYGLIDAALERVKVIMSGLVGLAGDAGFTLMQVDWRGDSADLIDDGFHTITRNAGFTIAQGWR